LLLLRTQTPDIGFPGPIRYALRQETCRVEFAVKHMVLATARGYLAAIGGELVVDAFDPLDSCVRVDLDATSLDTGSAERDELLRGPDFLDVARFPVITFESTDVSEVEPTLYVVWGDLYLKDLVGELPLQTRLAAAGPDAVTFAATTVLSRRAFGLTWSNAMEKFGVTVADTVKITLAAEFGA